MGNTIGVLIARELDVPKFIKDVLNFVKYVPLVPNFISGGEQLPITSLWVPKGTNESWIII